MIAWKNISIIDYKMLYSIQNTYLIYSGKNYNWELIIYLLFHFNQRCLCKTPNLLQSNSINMRKFNQNEEDER